MSPPQGVRQGEATPGPQDPQRVRRPSQHPGKRGPAAFNAPGSDTGKPGEQGGSWERYPREQRGLPTKGESQGPPGAAGAELEPQEAGGAPWMGVGRGAPHPEAGGAEGRPSAGAAPAQPARERGAVPLGTHSPTPQAAAGRHGRGLPRGDGGHDRGRDAWVRPAPCPASGSTTARRPSSWTSPSGPSLWPASPLSPGVAPAAAPWSRAGGAHPRGTAPSQSGLSDG